MSVYGPDLLFLVGGEKDLTHHVDTLYRLFVCAVFKSKYNVRQKKCSI